MGSVGGAIFRDQESVRPLALANVIVSTAVVLSEQPDYSFG